MWRIAAVLTLTVIALVVGCSSPAVKLPVAKGTVASTPPPTLDTGRSPISSASADVARYAGDAACESCHREIARSHSTSGHALTLQHVGTGSLSGRFRRSNPVLDPTNDTTYRAEVRHGRCVMTAEGPVGETIVPAEWALGSGRNGQTYLGRLAGRQWLTLRVSYYANLKGWDFTPSERPDPLQTGELNGHALQVGQVESCLSCHATTLTMRWDGPDPYLSHLGVGCERCHGPGKAHIAAMHGRANAAFQNSVGIEDLKRAGQARISDMCGACHRSESALQPGDPDPSNNLARFKSTALEMSACFRKSGTLTCVSCHDPHRQVVTGGNAYEAVCLTCHIASKAATFPHRNSVRVCTVNSRTGCIPCHMPSQTPSTFPHTVMHSHWIKVWSRHS